jgi:SAM-dependent methyltransferase
MAESFVVDPANAEAARAWDGTEGEYWATHATAYERSLAAYDTRFLGAAGVGAGSRVIDAGCGTGATTRAVAQLAPSGSALGVDLSARMIEVARLSAERAGLNNAEFLQADAQIHPFPERAADVVVSRTAVMFFGDPEAAFRNLGRALRPGGRLVFLVWQSLARNEWMNAIRGALAAGRDLPVPPPDAPGPFGMSDPARVRGLLAGAGFTGVTIDGLEEPVYLGPTAQDAFELIAGQTVWMLEGLDADRRAGALGSLHAAMEEHHTGDGVRFGSAAWLVTAHRP